MVVLLEFLMDEFEIIQNNDPYFKGRKHLTDNDFYTDEYRRIVLDLNNTNNFNDNKYIEVGVQYLAKSRDEVMVNVVNLLDKYCEIYKVPPIKIGNKEWDILFNETYKFYTEYDLEYFFEQDMLALNRLAVSRTLLYQKNSLDISDYINSFNYLDSMVLIDREKHELGEHINSLCNKCKVISINRFLKKQI